MAEVQRKGQPDDNMPSDYKKDLNPHEGAGLNHGLDGKNPEKAGLNAYDIKELHDKLQDFTDDELKQIVIIPHGSRLAQTATYIDLNNPKREEFTAMGAIEADANNYYVPKSEIGYQLWNKLIGVENPERTGEAN